jgi:hypothetical protein
VHPQGFRRHEVVLYVAFALIAIVYVALMLGTASR